MGMTLMNSLSYSLCFRLLSLVHVLYVCLPRELVMFLTTNLASSFEESQDDVVGKIDLAVFHLICSKLVAKVSIQHFC